MDYLKIKVEAKDCSHTLFLERIAVTKLDNFPTMLVASVAGSATSIKAFRTGLFTKGAKFILDGYRDVFGAYDKGYVCKTHRLAGDTFQLLVIARLPGLLTVSSDEGLWREISGPRYTTPLLKEWVPWLRKRLEADELLKPVRSVGCDVVRLLADEAQLDALVCEGLQNGEISI